MLRATIVVVLCAGCRTFAQLADSRPAFEVATIKPSAPSPAGQGLADLIASMPKNMVFGPGRGDASRVTFSFMSLSNLVILAYRINPYQLSAPNWLGSERFDIAAKIPEGANREQTPLMLQNLLAERFPLTSAS